MKKSNGIQDEIKNDGKKGKIFMAILLIIGINLPFLYLFELNRSIQHKSEQAEIVKIAETSGVPVLKQQAAEIKAEWHKQESRAARLEEVGDLIFGQWLGAGGTAAVLLITFIMVMGTIAAQD